MLAKGSRASLVALVVSLTGCPSSQPPAAPAPAPATTAPAPVTAAPPPAAPAVVPEKKKEEAPVFGSGKKTQMVSRESALPGRAQKMPVPAKHFVNGQPLQAPFPEGTEQVVFGLGCFWGAEKLFWKTPGVVTTAVGYAGGVTPNPTYEEVCSGRTGHTEVVLVVFDPKKVTFEQLLKVFYEGHDPTQGMRQGNDVGTQYRSAIYTTSDAQKQTAERAQKAYDAALVKAGYSPITTELAAAGEFYYAEGYHQQYLGKNPNGYCGLGGTGVSCPIGAKE